MWTTLYRTYESCTVIIAASPNPPSFELLFSFSGNQGATHLTTNHTSPENASLHYAKMN